MSYTAIFEVSF